VATYCGDIFYLEKAYDAIWKYGILKDLYNAGLRGNMPKLISKYISLELSLAKCVCPQPIWLFFFWVCPPTIDCLVYMYFLVL